MTINKSINPKLPKNSLSINIHLLRLRLNLVEMNKTFEIYLNPLRLTPPYINTQLHKTLRIQLIKLEVEPFQNLI